MTDTAKHKDVYDGPPDHIPDQDLNEEGRAKRKAAGRKYNPDAKAPSEKKSFFKKD